MATMAQGAACKCILRAFQVDYKEITRCARGKLFAPRAFKIGKGESSLCHAPRCPHLNDRFHAKALFQKFFKTQFALAFPSLYWQQTLKVFFVFFFIYIFIFFQFGRGRKKFGLPNKPKAFHRVPPFKFPWQHQSHNHAYIGHIT